MSEPRELTGIERELVLQYLRDDNVPVTVTLEEKPLARDAEIDSESEQENEPAKEERIPTSALFPVAIPAQQLTVLNQGIILLKNTSATRTVQPFIGKTVRVQFYFNHVGLYFITEMKECSQGLAIVVPGSIYRMEDVVSTVNWDFTASLAFKDSEGNDVQIECVPTNGYRLFLQPLWDEIEIERQKDAKKALESYVAEARAEGGVSIGNGLHLLRVCRYLTSVAAAPVQQAVEGRVPPLYVLYVDENRLVLASDTEDTKLELEENYECTMSLALPAQKIIKRIIKTECVVENIYSAESENDMRKCYVCRFTDMQEEDKRYLSEKMQMRR